MIPKPKHLGPEYGEQFKDYSVVEAYAHRPSYPEETFDILAGLITEVPRVVLDVGCGRGDIARKFVKYVDRIDAVDFSQNMVEKGKSLPGGNTSKIQWIIGPVETVLLASPYALITAGASLHWMEWDIVLPRFRDILTSRGFLAIVGINYLPNRWEANLSKVIQRHTTNRDYQPYNLVEELETRHLFQKRGEKRTVPVQFAQTIENYIESFHARNGFSRERMDSKSAAAFDEQGAALLQQYSRAGMLEMQIVGEVIWGIPGSVEK